MTSDQPNRDAADNPVVLVGFDGSDDATAAIEVAASLFPGVSARIAHIWVPPFTAHPSPELLYRAGSLDRFFEVQDGQCRARGEAITAAGVSLATKSGWQAQPLTRRGMRSEGFELARIAEELDPLALVLGARGLSGVRAVLGSVSDAAVHYSPVPVLVVPRTGADAMADQTGPLLVAHDGSSGAATALEVATKLWPSRRIVIASVACPSPDSTFECVELAAEGVPETARSIADALALHAAAIGAAAVVVGSRGRSARREILLGSVAMATLHHVHRPVLAVPPPNRLAGERPERAADAEPSG